MFAIFETEKINITKVYSMYSKHKKKPNYDLTITNIHLFEHLL